MQEDYNELLAESFDHLNKGRSRMALTTAKKVYDIRPEEFRSICCYAWANLENGNPHQALELANYAVQIHPDETDTRLYRGYLLMRLSIFEGAVSDLEYAISHNTDMIMWAYCNKARALAGLGKYFEALEDIESVIKLFGTDPKLSFIKAKLKFIIDTEEKKLKGIYSKKKTLLNDAEEAFGEKEYWFSLWASREIVKSVKENPQANLLELESMSALFQFRPAIAKAEQVKHLFINDDRFQSLKQRIQKAIVSDNRDDALQKKDNIEIKKWKLEKDGTNVFDVLNAKTYDLLENLRSGKRTYLLQFDEENILYIGVETVIDNPFFGNKRMVADGMAVWYLNNMEVGRHQFDLPLEKEWASVEFVQSWGTDNPGFWRKGQGKVDLYLNLEKICTRWFYIGNSEIVNFETAENKEGKFEHQERAEINQPNNVSNAALRPAEEKSLEELLEELNTFVGLNKVKQSMKDFVDYLIFINERKKLGLKTQENLPIHCVFLGNPGTGKTTVARLLGKVFRAMGILKNGHVIEVDRSGLVGQYVGETAQKTEKVISEALGGLLFIDEAYTLIKQGSQQDFGREALDILLKRMEDKAGEFVVITAGYPDEMINFINSNPGMKSRFSHFFTFEDYTPEELVDIFKLTSEKEEYTIKPDALDLLKKELTRLYRKRDKTFGNARLIRNLFSESKIQLSKRYLKEKPEENRTREAMTTIISDDIKSVMKSSIIKDINIGIDEENLKTAINKLNSLIGLDSVKKEINELVKVARYYIEQGENPQNKFNSHIVFLGNPGTGKTTVARLFSEIYSALGILPRGHLVEADRQMLVAGYVGQTAVRTKEIIDSAIGGTLFIDEAYTLGMKGESNESDFGHEAIDTLLKRMEDDRGKFLVIAAGYTDNMNKFLESNPGLQSRFTKKIFFEDYSPEELLIITEKYLNEKGHSLDEEVIEPLKNYYNSVYRDRDKTFGNARLVRNLIDSATKNHMLRLVDFPPEERHEEAIKLFTFDDIKDLIVPKKVKENLLIEGDPHLLSQYIKELNDLAGLESVKKSVDKLLNSLKVSKLRERRGLKVLPRNLHALFIGNAGTGKTTVARLLSKIYKEMGILERGHLVEVDRTTLVAGYQGQTAIKTDTIIQKAIGGTLFIDEVYTLIKNENDPGQEALDTLLKRMDDYQGKFVIIASGLTNEMNDFIKFYPSLQSRFTNNFIFEDFTPRQMLEIALNISDKNGYKLDEGAWQQLHEFFSELYNNRDINFGNARTVRNILYKAISNQEERILKIVNPSNDDLCTIILEDIASNLSNS
ncbi:MAG: AAA family ATPase [Ignavibacteriaceae bacterium]|nr:AAA family ATPase [Ignavibacteriaceae bacterium]